MIDLQECRNEIDKIDSDIIRLFEQRMKVCEDVAENIDTYRKEGSGSGKRETEAGGPER